ncbi:MAG: glycosyltransferase family 2 protein [Muribaculaceae bacterium]|nr:glycosyltransferase family 2 protein [Muribaculaceae bacterium]
MWIKIYYLFSYTVFFYTIAAMLWLLYLAIQSIRAQNRLKINLPDDDTIRYILKASPITPAVSIIAPAYNEEKTIIENVHSLLQVYYPDFEVIIVNDESTDKTLELLIEEFDLVEVPFTNSMRVPSKPITSVMRSQNEQYKNLVIVNKEHGGRKADGTNAGINVCTNPYFVSTDVDCIIEPMALYRMMWLVVNSHDPMMGVGASMFILNGCKVEDGTVTKPGISLSPIPLFQQLEYMRSFLIGKLGWSPINALPNISGGFGLFNTEVVVKSGGYDSLSMAEDVDMLLRMVTYMKNSGQKFRLAQVPQVCCWTEGPETLHMLYRQRVRWARGLCEVVSHHIKLFFNINYGPTGGVILPYIWLFEFIAPILEASGFVFMIWLILIGAVNWSSALLIFGMIYIFSVSLSFVVLVFDYATNAVKWRHRFISYLKLILAGLLEPFIYHPIITTFSLIGYWNFLTQRTAEWKTIRRTGFGKRKKEKDNSETTEDK